MDVVIEDQGSIESLKISLVIKNRKDVHKALYYLQLFSESELMEMLPSGETKPNDELPGPKERPKPKQG